MWSSKRVKKNRKESWIRGLDRLTRWTHGVRKAELVVPGVFWVGLYVVYFWHFGR
jgi:hypothetical protein